MSRTKNDAVQHHTSAFNSIKLFYGGSNGINQDLIYFHRRSQIKLFSCMADCPEPRNSIKTYSTYSFLISIYKPSKLLLQLLKQ